MLVLKRKFLKLSEVGVVLDKKPINPYATGAQFLDYCVKHGRLTEEGSGRNKRLYATSKGQKKLKEFGIEVVFEKPSK